MGAHTGLAHPPPPIEQNSKYLHVYVHVHVSTCTGLLIANFEEAEGGGASAPASAHLLSSWTFMSRAILMVPGLYLCICNIVLQLF